VPLDRSGRVPGTLDLRVATAGPATAPRTLVYLTGGPGQPGVPFGPKVRGRLKSLLGTYRLVLLDQRGTGAPALNCPRLQREMGTSDLTVPTRAAVADCARRLGDRRGLFSTADTVDDLEDLRTALGAPKLALDGVSYGTFVAERYAIAHPGRVDRLVLDSVVPAAGLDGLEADGMRRTAQVLPRSAADLAAVVRRDGDGPELLDTIVALSVGAPSFPGVARALRRALAGDRAPLRRLVTEVHHAQAAPRRFFSAGLHAATLCADIRAPWGRPDAPAAGRAAAVARAAARVDPGPFDRATVTGNGWIRLCELWPPTRTRPVTGDGTLPPVPALLLAGDRDLSTPMPWPRAQLARTPRGRLLVARDAGHSVQSRARDPRVRRAVIAFLRAP
jgi:pimeloyl-ACP methyl ester carboxylesterase